MYSKNERKKMLPNSPMALRTKLDYGTIKCDDLVKLKELTSYGGNDYPKGTEIKVSRFIAGDIQKGKVKWTMIGFLRNNPSVMIKTDISNVKKA